jgi:hypothetical protein
MKINNIVSQSGAHLALMGIQGRGVLDGVYLARVAILMNITAK